MGVSTLSDVFSREKPFQKALDDHVPSPRTGLSPEEELVLQQLEQARFWSLRAKSAGTAGGRFPVGNLPGDIPPMWELTRGLSLHDWQTQCVNAWFEGGKRGVIKVVTGAGKTILALAIAERLQQEHPDLRVAIVVPTIVLLEQWRDELMAHGNLPVSAIASMGGGYSGGFDESTRILICVLNSAAKKLPKEVERAGVAGNLLLIVDECHRAGAAEMKQIFAAQRVFSLGLSATPERTDDPTPGVEDEDQAGSPTPFAETVLGRELGPVVFEMNYAEAIQRNVLPPFRIVHYGLALGPQEREGYDRLSREIKELREELETPSRRGLALIRWCRSQAGAKNPQATQFLALTGERKRLLYRMSERFRAVLAILGKAFKRNPDAKAILFHESIDEVMGLFTLLREAGYAVVAEHSEFPDAMRAESLRLFRRGTARIIVSARTLIEGFNVPSADVGIIVAASSSVRQRVQTLGRLLRRSLTPEGADKQATLFVLYAAGTVDELIYEKADWEQFVGAERNDYFVWQAVAGAAPRRSPGPPRRPALDEMQVDATGLIPGGPYPGDADQGRKYSLDTQGTVRDENGNLIRPHQELHALLANLRGSGGRFRITPRRSFVTRLEKTAQGWQATFLGQLKEPVQMAGEEQNDVGAQANYSPGDVYPLARVKGKVFSVLQRDKRLIAKKQRGHIDFVQPAEILGDVRKRAALLQIQRVLNEAYSRGHRVSKITVTGEGHVVYVQDNQAYFVGNAPEGADGFAFEEKQKSSA